MADDAGREEPAMTPHVFTRMVERRLSYLDTGENHDTESL